MTSDDLQPEAGVSVTPPSPIPLDGSATASQPAAGDPPASLPEMRRASSPGRRRAAWTVAVGAILVLAVAAFAGGVAIDRIGLVPGALPQPPAGLREKLPLLYQAWSIVDQHYVDQGAIDPTKQTYGAIQGLLGSLGDTGHTDFMTPQEAADMSSALSGKYVGIGVELTQRKDGTDIVTVFEGSPAAKAGLRAGDRIVAVEGQDVTGLSYDVLRSKIRGPAGTSVRISILRPGEMTPRELVVARAEIAVPVVTWAMAPGGHTALVRLESFSSGATDALKTALDKAGKAGATSVVLDLRGNPGGYVTEAIGVASQFLSSGNVYLQRDAQGKETANAVTKGGVATHLPLVVLVDDGTASAAEIVSGALQDAGRAKIVGVTTYGTGTVLSTYHLSDGSEVRIGVAEWLTPKGRQIWHHGIQPDVPVTLPSGTAPVTPSTLAGMSATSLQASGDTQLLRALELLGGNG